MEGLCDDQKTSCKQQNWFCQALFSLWIELLFYAVWKPVNETNRLLYASCFVWLRIVLCLGFDAHHIFLDNSNHIHSAPSSHLTKNPNNNAVLDPRLLHPSVQTYPGLWYVPLFYRDSDSKFVDSLFRSRTAMAVFNSLSKTTMIPTKQRYTVALILGWGCLLMIAAAILERCDFTTVWKGTLSYCGTIVNRHGQYYRNHKSLYKWYGMTCTS